MRGACPEGYPPARAAWEGWRGLEAAGLLLSDADETAYGARVAAAGRGVAAALEGTWRAPDGGGGWDALAGGIGTTAPAIRRALGFGYLQGAAFARAGGLDDVLAERAGHLGALLNVGVSVFDHVLDRAEAPGARTSGLSAGLVGWARARLHGPTPVPTEPPLLALVAAPVAAFLDATERHVLGEPARAHLRARLHTMLAAELAATQATRTTAAPTRALWRDLRAKSVLPYEVMATVALALARRSPPGASSVLVGARRAGVACWIVDDLVDLSEDGAAGAWSRPWFRLRRSQRQGGASDLGAVVADEVALLGAALRSLQRAGDADARARDLGVCFTATVQSWLRSPGPGPPG